MMSAPHSRSTAPADGTNPYIATSRTRIPSSGLLISRLPLARSSLVPRCDPHSRSSSGSSADNFSERLGLQELLESRGPHLPADAGLLVSAERAVGAEVVAAV